MTLSIHLPPDLEHRLVHAAANTGQDAADITRALLATWLGTAELAEADRAERVLALLDRWDAEDEAAPEAEPALEISPISLRIPDVD